MVKMKNNNGAQRQKPGCDNINEPVEWGGHLLYPYTDTIATSVPNTNTNVPVHRRGHLQCSCHPQAPQHEQEQPPEYLHPPLLSHLLKRLRPYCLSSKFA